MKENRINALISITALVAAIFMIAALSLAIGKWSFGQATYNLVIRFPNATGINTNSAVKYAGASIGRVKAIRLVPRSEQAQNPTTHEYDAIEITAAIDQGIEIGEDSTAIIKQDGLGISAKYLLIMPGPDHTSKALADGAVLQGNVPFDISNLAQPAGEALTLAKTMLTQLEPMISRLDTLTLALNTQVPGLLTHADKFLTDGDGVLANLNTPESRERLANTLASLRVASENLKVVSYNAKALTATLAQKPWRVFWGGDTIPATPEGEALRSDKVIPLKGNGDSSFAPAEKTDSAKSPGQIN